MSAPPVPARAAGYRPWRRRHGALPMNTDIEVARTIAGVPVVVRLRASYVGLAALGGALGAAARFGLVHVTPSWQTLSAGTGAVNIVGPLLLGVLIGVLGQGVETRRRRALRLVVGVGFLGALTSYAQLTLDAVVVAEHRHVVLAVVYVLATVVVGAVAAWAGLAGASAWHRRQGRRRDDRRAAESA